MPIYCYTNDKGVTQERFFTMGAAPESIVVDGTKYSRNYSLEHRGQARGGEGWPIHSESMRVLPNQIEKTAELAHSKGVPTDFDRGGRPIWTNENHKQKYIKAFGYFDKQSFTR